MMLTHQHVEVQRATPGKHRGRRRDAGRYCVDQGEEPQARVPSHYLEWREYQGTEFPHKLHKEPSMLWHLDVELLASVTSVVLKILICLQKPGVKTDRNSIQASQSLAVSSASQGAHWQDTGSKAEARLKTSNTGCECAKWQFNPLHHNGCLDWYLQQWAKCLSLLVIITVTR